MRSSHLAAVLFLSLTIAPCRAQAPKPSSPMELVQLAADQSPQLQQAIEASFPAKDLQSGAAWSGHLQTFFFAVRASSQPLLFIDDAPGPAMQAIASTDLWFASAQILPLGALHSFHYKIDGKDFGGKSDIPAFTELSYLMPGVKQGKLSPQLTITSKIYNGMESNYWIYVPDGYDASVPAALMIFQDGAHYIQRDTDSQTLNGIDNLIALKKTPMMICVFINPGKIGAEPGNPTYDFVKALSDKRQSPLDNMMRSTLYDTVSDRYPRFLRDELIPKIAAKYNLRKDAYSRAITGLSSGGICAFNAAWQMPDQFSRVISWIGSFESLEWKETPGVPDGGQDYPAKVLHEPHRNIRVWLQDGSNDLETQWGSWPLANLRMANALKRQEYDFHLSFGKGSHNTAHGESEFPQEMIWLWRDYDPAKTEQTYTIDPAEKAKLPFRVQVFNRDAN